MKLIRRLNQDTYHVKLHNATINVHAMQHTQRATFHYTCIHCRYKTICNSLEFSKGSRVILLIRPPSMTGSVITIMLSKRYGTSIASRTVKTKKLCTYRLRCSVCS